MSSIKWFDLRDSGAQLRVTNLSNGKHLFVLLPCDAKAPALSADKLAEAAAKLGFMQSQQGFWMSVDGDSITLPRLKAAFPSATYQHMNHSEVFVARSAPKPAQAQIARNSQSDVLSDNVGKVQPAKDHQSETQSGVANKTLAGESHEQRTDGERSDAATESGSGALGQPAVPDLAGRGTGKDSETQEEGRADPETTADQPTNAQEGRSSAEGNAQQPPQSEDFYGGRGARESDPNASEGNPDGGSEGTPETGNIDASRPVKKGFRFEDGVDHRPFRKLERARENVDAIRLAHRLNKEGAEPSAEELLILSKYSGWGGIPEVFGFIRNQDDESRALRDIADELHELRRAGVIDPQSYASMRESVLNAHFTHSGIIRPIWQAIQQMNINTERGLEPAFGTGNFLSWAPADLKAKMTAVELDTTTSLIGKLLHPQAHVINKGLENSGIPSEFYDFVVSNFPFGDYSVYDDQNPRWNYRIHDYFFMKSLQALKPGGVIAAVTSSGTLDKSDSSVRKAIAEQAHLIGAVRLPRGAFRQSSNTDVVTDILFLQKKGDFEPSYEPQSFEKLATMEVPVKTGSSLFFAGKELANGDMVGYPVNEYFASHPEMVLGEHYLGSGYHGPTLYVDGPTEIAEIEKKLSAIVQKLPANIRQPVSKPQVSVSELQARYQQTMSAASIIKPMIGSIVYENDQFMRVASFEETEDGELNLELEPCSVPKKHQKGALQVIEILQCTRELLHWQTVESTDEVEAKITTLRDRLNALYDTFVEKHGPLQGKVWSRLFQDDPASAFLWGLENYDEETNTATKQAIFTKRVVAPVIRLPDHIESSRDALALSMAHCGRVDLSLISQWTKKDPATIIDELRGLIFLDPQSGEWVDRSEYLSGNVRAKLRLAEQYADLDDQYFINVEALKTAQPEPLKPSQIKVGMDAFWLPQDLIESFIKQGIGIDPSDLDIRFDEINRHWVVKASRKAWLESQYEQILNHRWGTERKNTLALLNHIFTNTHPTVRDKISSNPDKYQVNAEQTLLAQSKLESITEAWQRWIYQDPERAARVADIYNEKFNVWRMRDYDGSHLVYPGMAAGWRPYKHQNDFIWRAVSGNNALTAHVVGAGKTMQLVGSAIKGKQIGRWQKPLVVVPNHMLRQFAGDAQTIYPNAKILVMNKDDVSAKKRDQFAAKCAMHDWDLVVCTHSTYSRIGAPEAFNKLMIEEEIEKLENYLYKINHAPDIAMSDTDKRQTVKDIQSKIKKHKTKLERLNGEQKHDVILTLDRMGIDFLGVDEAHYYKNLSLDSSSNIPGLSASESKRAWDMFVKCRYVASLHNGPEGVVFATGTPISNSIVECYTFTRMIRPDLLESVGINNFNDWMGLFGEVVHGMELKPEGSGYHVKSRLRFKNVPELIKMIRSFIDFKTREDLNLPTPEVDRHNIVAPQSDLMKLFMKYIEARAKCIRMRDIPEKDREALAELREMLYGANDKTFERGELFDDDVGALPEDILLTVATDGRKASLDLRLIHPGFPDDPNSKVNLCVRKVKEIYDRTSSQKLTQMIFCDFSSPTGKGKFNVYDDMKKKWMDMGIPANEIAFIHDCATDDDKEALFEKVRSGEVRILLGSTMKMGVGTNVQERMTALHHLDPPWKPADIEQRDGRIERQGNILDKVEIYQYTTRDSFDLFMWETLNRKLKMIQQAMSKPDEAEREIDENVEMGYEEVMAVTTGNPKIREFIELRMEVDHLTRLQRAYLDGRADGVRRIAEMKDSITKLEESMEMRLQDKKLVQENQPIHLTLYGNIPPTQQGDTCYIGGPKAVGAALARAENEVQSYQTRKVGTIGGMDLLVFRKALSHTYILKSPLSGMGYEVANGDDPMGNIIRIYNELDRIASRDSLFYEARIEDIKNNMRWVQEDIERPFEHEQMLEDKRARLESLMLELGDLINNGSSIDWDALGEFTAEIRAANLANEEDYQLGDNLKMA